MFKAIRVMSILLAANTEAVVLIFLASWLGKQLNQNYPMENLDWTPISFGAAIVLITISWGFLLRLLFREMKQSS